MFITRTWQRGARCFLIAITDPPGFCSACTLPTAQGQGQKDQLFFSSPDPIVRPSVQLYSLDLINSELFRWVGPLPCRLLFFSAAKGGGGNSWKTCESGAVNNIDFGSHRAFHSCHLYSKSLSFLEYMSGLLSDCLGLFFYQSYFQDEHKMLLLMANYDAKMTYSFNSNYFFFRFRPKKAILKSKLNQIFNFECQNF